MTTLQIGAFASATEMLRALGARHLTATELLEMHLERIERFNPVLNAIVTFCFDDARERAAAADAARAQGDDAPLLGLPLTIKDCIDVAGLRGTMGVTDHANRCAEQDSRVAARVRAAGGVLIGKTNVPPFAGDWQAVNQIFGRTNNPWDLDRTPGGSTGGGAAALAAGLAPLELGSDIGGSVRVPAAFCGVYGHRPSETAVPRSGHFPGTPLPNWATAMGVQGPLARTAEDLELALDVISGPEIGEDVAWRLQIPPARHQRLADFRVAVLPPISWLPVDAAITDAIDRLARGLRNAGAVVERTQPEGFGDLQEHQGIYLSMLLTLTSGEMRSETRDATVAALRATDTAVSNAMARGLTAGASDYIRWHGQRERYRAAYRDFFREWDVLLSPAFITPAFRHLALDVPDNERFHEVDGQRVPYILGTTYPAVATLSGQPATAFPAGQTTDGLPVGLQVIGPYLEDRTPIRFAALVAEAFGGFVAPPGYA